VNSQVVRIIAFVAGAVAAIASAIVIALEAGIQVRPVHWFALGGTALATYAMKWVGDVSAAEAKEREERARRASEYPPPSDMTTQKFNELVRDIHLGKVELRDEDKP
jgi:hypothetical protein